MQRAVAKIRAVIAATAVVTAAVAVSALAQQQQASPSSPEIKPSALATPISPSANGADDARRAQVQAAASNAASNLREQVLRMPLSRTVDVRQFVDRTHTDSALSAALQDAQQIGSPRWVDDRTCQVRLEVPASSVGQVLLDEAHRNPQQSPVSAEDLQQRVTEWNRMSFFAVGSAVAGESIENAAPHAAVGAWAKVSEVVRRKTISRAREDAVAQVLDDVAPVALNQSVHVQDALRRQEIGPHVSRWLSYQPVTRVEFLEDLRVSVTIAPSAKSLTSTLQVAVTADKDFLRDQTVDWDRVEQDIAAHIGPTVGTARVFAGDAAAVPPAPSPQNPTSVLPATVLPLQPPDWMDSTLEADATARGVAGVPRLKTANTAEAKAIDTLKEKLLALHVTQTSTLADAVKSDEHLTRGVDRAMLHARISKVDYLPDGSVRAQASLDMQNAWDELRSNP
jgi:hypothetical protein